MEFAVGLSLAYLLTTLRRGRCVVGRIYALRAVIQASWRAVSCLCVRYTCIMLTCRRLWNTGRLQCRDIALKTCLFSRNRDHHHALSFIIQRLCRCFLSHTLRRML